MKLGTVPLMFLFDNCSTQTFCNMYM